MKLHLPEINLSLLGDERETALQWNLNAGEEQEFSRSITYLNVVRTRNLCLLVAIIEALALILSYLGHMQYGDASALGGNTIVPFLIANTAVSLCFYLGVRRPASPSGLQPWHRPAMILTVVAILSLFAAISVIRQAVGTAISPFMISLLVCAAGLCLYPWQSLIIFSASSGVLLTSFFIFQPGDFRFPIVFNGSAMVAFAYAISVAHYQKEKRDFKRKRMLEAANEKLAVSERNYRQLVENSPIGIIRTSPSGEVLEGNAALLRTLHFKSVADINAYGFINLYEDPDDRDRLLSHVGKGPASGFLTRFHLPDGAKIAVSLGAYLVRDAQGDAKYLEGTIEDVTARKKAEEAAQESRQRLAAIIDFLPIATIVIDRDGRVTAWNKAVEQMTGVKAEDILGKGDHEYGIPFYAERRSILIDLVFASPEELRTKYMHVQAENGVLAAEAVCPALPGGARHLLGFAAALHDSHGNVTGAIECMRDITDFRRTEAQLKEAKEIADAANQAKSVFLATMSHEIRTPMNAIIGMTGLLIDSTLAPQQRDFVQTIRDSSEALLTIINDILDFSKIEAGKLELECNPYDLRGCVESTFELLGHRATENGLEMGYWIDPKVPGMVIGDSTRVSQILTNLVGNAIKFTEKGEITVSAVARPREAESVLKGVASAAGARPNETDNIHTGKWYEIEFAVKDTGLGIPGDRMDRLFKSFSQVDSSMTRKYGGTGLGLAISRRLSEMMGGSIRAESEPEKGSTFYFTIRVEEARADAIQAHLAFDQPYLRDRCMLIVDDNPTNCKILSLQAESWGMQSRQASSGDEALGIIARNDPFDIAVLDMQMPGMDGLALADAIRKHRDARSLPLILLSSIGMLSDDPRLNYFSANLTKPVRSSKLYNVLIDTLAPKIIPAERKGPDPADNKMDNFADMAREYPLRILVAEDNGNNQKLIRIILQRMGYLPEITGNGKEAIAALERQSYDVVLMDVQMPEMDGLEATGCIRRQFQKDRQPCIIAMTANAMQGDREQCLDAGMDDYVSKPIRVNELATALKNVRVRASRNWN